MSGRDVAGLVKWVYRNGGSKTPLHVKTVKGDRGRRPSGGPRVERSCDHTR